MSVKVEKLEGSMIKLEITVPAADFAKAVQGVYNRRKGNLNVPGFRKGKAPLSVIEKIYGEGIFFEDAANDCINNSYPVEADASGEAIVSAPSINVVQIGKDKDFIYTAEVAVKPPVELGQYKGIEIAKQNTEVTEEEVAASLENERKKNATTKKIEDRAVVSGDEIKLDFEGFVDGEAFSGGKGTDYPLTIGSGQFIPGFEDQLVGAEIGKEVEVNVTFPETYGSQELAGKAAMFKCTVKEINEKVLPELNDEFADEVSEFSTLEEYKADLAKKLAETKEKDAQNARENLVMSQIIANAKMELPEPMIQAQVDQQINDFAQRLQMQGLSLDQYLEYIGQTAEQLGNQFRPQAISQIQGRLVLEEIVKAENIVPTEEDFDNEIKSMAEQYKMEESKVRELIPENQKEVLMNDLAVRKAVALVVAEAVEVEGKDAE